MTQGIVSDNALARGGADADGFQYRVKSGLTS